MISPAMLPPAQSVRAVPIRPTEFGPGSSRLLRFTRNDSEKRLSLRGAERRRNLDRRGNFALATSVWRPGDRPDLGEFARQFAPGIAGVFASVQFAVMAARDDQAGIGGMRRECPDRRIGRPWQIQQLPALAAILRALDRPGGADRAVTGRDKQRLRIVRLLDQAAAIGQVELLADAEPLPAVAAVMAREDLARRRRQHGRAAIDEHPDVVDVGIVDA